MEELRVAFLVIGSAFIIGVLVHGIWKMRRQNTVPQREPERIEPSSQTVSDGEAEFDEYGVGSVRVIAKGNDPAPSMEPPSSFEENDELQTNEVEHHDLEDIPSIDDETEVLASAVVEEEQVAAEVPMYASVVTQPKPHMSEINDNTTRSTDIPDPPEFLLKEDVSQDADLPVNNTEPDFGLSPTPTASQTETELPAEHKKPSKKRTTSRKRKEPTLGDDQMRIDFDEPEITESDDNHKTATASQPTTEVLAINVRVPEERALSGAALLPLLLTLGFKFGEHDIFHRHVNANGKGPVLFSLANMVKPGVFDIDNLENFTTPGITLFMVLPIEGDPHQVFNMMHNAARKIADEFEAQLLDGRRSILTKQGIQQYVEKIREFERQRIISGSNR